MHKYMIQLVFVITMLTMMILQAVLRKGRDVFILVVSTRTLRAIRYTISLTNGDLLLRGCVFGKAGEISMKRSYA